LLGPIALIGGGISALQVAVLVWNGGQFWPEYAPAAKKSAFQSKMLVKHHSNTHLKPGAQRFRVPT
jgi:hypothetical protein